MKLRKTRTEFSLELPPRVVMTAVMVIAAGLGLLNLSAYERHLDPAITAVVSSITRANIVAPDSGSIGCSR